MIYYLQIKNINTENVYKFGGHHETSTNYGGRIAAF